MLSSLLFIQDREIQNPRPHVRLIEPGLDCYTEKANDALGIISYEKYRPNLYALGESITLTLGLSLTVVCVGYLFS